MAPTPTLQRITRVADLRVDLGRFTDTEATITPVTDAGRELVRAWFGPGAASFAVPKSRVSAVSVRARAAGCELS